MVTEDRARLPRVFSENQSRTVVRAVGTDLNQELLQWGKENWYRSGPTSEYRVHQRGLQPRSSGVSGWEVAKRTRQGVLAIPANRIPAVAAGDIT